MVNVEILGGLISSLERGESLKKAMMSLYNAGYKKEEIEEAAMMTLGMDITSLKDLLLQQQNQTLDTLGISQVTPIRSQEQLKIQQATVKKTSQNNIPMDIQPIQRQDNLNNQILPPKPITKQEIILEDDTKKNQELQTKTKQNVSDYSSKPKKKKGDNIILILLILLLVFLVGILISLFIFREQVIGFFSRFFTGGASG